MRDFSIIVAADAKMGIGRGGALPWHLPGDMAHFKTVTLAAPAGKRNAVIMGRKTWESVPQRFRPLMGRLNVVLTRNPDFVVPAGVKTHHSLEDALKSLEAHRDIHQIFIIGGADLYAQAVTLPECRRLFLTRIDADFECEAFFPPVPTDFKQKFCSPVVEENSVKYRFFEYFR